MFCKARRGTTVSHILCHSLFSKIYERSVASHSKSSWSAHQGWEWMWSCTGFPNVTLQLISSPERWGSTASVRHEITPVRIPFIARSVGYKMTLKGSMADFSFYNWTLVIKTKQEARKICSSLSWDCDFLHGCFSPQMHSTALLIPRLCQRPSLPTPCICVLFVSYPLSVFFSWLFGSQQPFVWAGERPIQWHSRATALNKRFTVHFSLCIIFS